MISKLRGLWRALAQWRQVPRFGFLQGHTYLSEAEVGRIGELVGQDDPETIKSYEQRFARLIGEGRAVSFAAGRMGFYALMKLLDLGAGDEVILQGATCSVMANAVLRIGATPVYADIDPETFGSSVDAIRRVLSRKTRVIVAQHSFGIPCRITPIAALAREKGIFLVEDCALTLGSSVNGVVCGNFGDAALFSTDHSKPLNTMTGGLVYTRDAALYERLEAMRAICGALPAMKQQALWQQLILERKYCRPDQYGKMRLVSRFRSFAGIAGRPFIDEDFGSGVSASYPYPARMPSFLAEIGHREIDRWEKTKDARKALLQNLLDLFERHGEKMPMVYRDRTREIIPLRLAWASEHAAAIRNRLEPILDLPWTWFMQPIVASSEPLENFGYRQGQCPISEKTGPNMINIPCNIAPEWAERLVTSLTECMDAR
ncbi:MAG: DegT/DnrJ/EryC1/StrS family aminotransferase [Betaproteobacteria bacterium]|nr:DegT/DnrJ/EryC1/StrS family aminotransferase [Betaproteobacteria bacterium]